MGFFTKNRDSNDSQQATVISAGTVLKGEINSKSILYIDGGFEGSVNCSQMVVIGKSGRVKGLIIAQKVIINGFMHGNIDAENVDVLRGAVLIGDIITNDLTLENGSKFSGQSMFKTTIDISAFDDKESVARALDGGAAGKQGKIEHKAGGVDAAGANSNLGGAGGAAGGNSGAASANGAKNADKNGANSNLGSAAGAGGVGGATNSAGANGATTATAATTATTAKPELKGDKKIDAALDALNNATAAKKS